MSQLGFLLAWLLCHNSASFYLRFSPPHPLRIPPPECNASLPLDTDTTLIPTLHPFIHPWPPLGPHLNLTFTSHYSLAHWLVLTSTPPPLGSSPPYLNPTPPSLATSRPSPLLHTYILYPFYCFSPPRAALNVNHLPPPHTNRAQSLPHLSSLPLPPSLSPSLPPSLSLISRSHLFPSWFYSLPLLVDHWRPAGRPAAGSWFQYFFRWPSPPGQSPLVLCHRPPFTCACFFWSRLTRSAT